MPQRQKHETADHIISRVRRSRWMSEWVSVHSLSHLPASPFLEFRGCGLGPSAVLFCPSLSVPSFDFHRSCSLRAFCFALFVCLLCCWHRVSSCSFGCSGTWSVDQAGRALSEIWLPLLPQSAGIKGVSWPEKLLLPLPSALLFPYLYYWGSSLHNLQFLLSCDGLSTINQEVHLQHSLASSVSVASGMRALYWAEPWRGADAALPTCLGIAPPTVYWAPLHQLII